MQNIIKFSLVFFLISCSFKTYSCSCHTRPEIPKAYAKADAVFTGVVIDMFIDSGKDGVQKVFTIRVESKYKLRKRHFTTDTTVNIATRYAVASCGYPFKIGERYIIYANRKKARLTTYWCMRTKPYNEEEINKLNKIKKPKIVGSLEYIQNSKFQNRKNQNPNNSKILRINSQYSLILRILIQTATPHISRYSA